MHAQGGAVGAFGNENIGSGRFLLRPVNRAGRQEVRGQVRRYQVEGDERFSLLMRMNGRLGSLLSSSAS